MERRAILVYLLVTILTALPRAHVVRRIGSYVACIYDMLVALSITMRWLLCHTSFAVRVLNLLHVTGDSGGELRFPRSLLVRHNEKSN